jgi:hypothetical protein
MTWDACVSRIRSVRNLNPVARVSRTGSELFPAGAFGRTHRPSGRTRPSDSMVRLPYAVDETVVRRARLAMLDFGLKQNIVWNLTRRGCDVQVFPWNTPADEILAGKPEASSCPMDRVTRWIAAKSCRI